MPPWRGEQITFQRRRGTGSRAAQPPACTACTGICPGRLCGLGCGLAWALPPWPPPGWRGVCGTRRVGRPQAAVLTFSPYAHERPQESANCDFALWGTAHSAGPAPAPPACVPPQAAPGLGRSFEKGVGLKPPPPPQGWPRSGRWPEAYRPFRIRPEATAWWPSKPGHHGPGATEDSAYVRPGRPLRSVATQTGLW